MPFSSIQTQYTVYSNMSRNHYGLTDNQKKEYASGVLLEAMVNKKRLYSVVLEGADRDLESLFIYMLGKDYLDVDSHNRYIVTPRGLEKLDNLRRRYQEYLVHFDIYGAVDLEQGVFAFERIFDLNDEAWKSYVNRDNFVDLRIAVARFKKMNPTDIVFLSFLREGQFDTEQANWQFDLLSGLIWGQIEEIVESAIQIEDLGYQTESGETITGEAVIEDVIRQGAQLNIRLHTKEERLNRGCAQDFSDSGRDESDVENFEEYRSPRYVNSIWSVF